MTRYNCPVRGGRKTSPSLAAVCFTVGTCLLLLASTVINAFADSPISGFNPATLATGETSVSFDVKTFWADNALPLRAIYLDKWDGPYTPGNTNNSDTYWHADAGIAYKGWRVAGFFRGEQFLETNRDTVDILRMINLRQDLPVGRRFNVDLNVNGFTAAGVEVSKGVGLDRIVPGLKVGFTARYLNAQMIQDGSINGYALPITSKTYDFSLGLNYVYDTNFVYKMKNNPPDRGDGFSFDVGAKYSWRDKFEASVLVRDILGYIYWKAAPYTLADATSAVKTFDADGYQIFRPTIKGFEGYKNFTQKIPVKTDIDLSYKEGPFKLSGTLNLIEDRPIYWLEMDYYPLSKLVLSAGYNVNYQAYSMGVGYGKLLVKAYLDDFDLRRAKALGLILSCSFAW
jgi:hypothetical protein